MATTELRIEGGYIGIDARELLHTWRTCLGGPPGIGGFRAWLAAREMVARRHGATNRRAPRYDIAELARLLGVSERTATASVRRLVRAGLLSWTESAISFPPMPNQTVEQLDDTIGRGRGVVALPRRLLRHLARGARPALIATALASLFRCLSRRRTGFLSRGRLAASWVAGAFGVDLRRVKQARAELVALGWLAPAPSAKWATNRWGAAWTVNLAWSRPRGDRHPGPVQIGASLPPPCLDLHPLQERSDPEPGEPGPTGASLAKDGQRPPDLRDIRPIDLVVTDHVVELHRQAVARGVVTASERDRVRFMAAAEHAKAVATRNAPGLLARIVSRGWWHLIGQADEDRARRRLREHQRTGLPPEGRGLARIDARDMPAAGAFRSPYAPERPAREPSALGDLLARLATSPRSILG